MYGWTNATAAGEDGVVWKRFLGPEPAHRYEVERGVLQSLTGRLPVPAVVAERDPWTLGTARVGVGSALEARVRGVDLVALHRELGALLRLLHDLDPATVDAPLDGDGPAVLHGDFGSHNAVTDEAGGVAVIVDWERARRGEPVEDLAWAECIASLMFPVPRDALVALYDGYGTRFSVADRTDGLARAIEAFRRRSLADRWPPAPFLIFASAATYRFTPLT